MRPTKVYSAPRLSHLPAGFTLVRLLRPGGFLLCRPLVYLVGWLPFFLGFP